MLNILSYVGMNLQAELCLWTLLGLIRTIFDATLFKVNANLKQVWQMEMPAELSMPVQRALRTMISGVMLVQCFTVYVYLASYIVLLYPVFLEERPTLVLPWLLLAAIRKLLCELTSLALGLGTCAMLGPARPPCIRFVTVKVASITPSFYMWMLVFSYYSNLKTMATFKLFSAVPVANSSAHDCLELAVRRRRTKSLQGEEVLRKKLVANFNYGESTIPPVSDSLHIKPEGAIGLRMMQSTNAYSEEIEAEMREVKTSTTALPADTARSSLGAYDDWFGSDMVVPRDADRILEQFVIMMLRIGVYISPDSDFELMRVMRSHSRLHQTLNNIDCSTLPTDGAETPPMVGNFKGRVSSYVENYPQIFRKKPSASDALQISNELNFNSQNPPVEYAAANSSDHSVITERIFPRDKIDICNDEQQNTISCNLPETPGIHMLPVYKDMFCNDLDDLNPESQKSLENQAEVLNNNNLDQISMNNQNPRNDQNDMESNFDKTFTNLQNSLDSQINLRGEAIDVQFNSVKIELSIENQDKNMTNYNKKTSISNPMEVDQIEETLRKTKEQLLVIKNAYNVRDASTEISPEDEIEEIKNVVHKIKSENEIAFNNPGTSTETEMVLEPRDLTLETNTSSSDIT